MNTGSHDERQMLLDLSRAAAALESIAQSLVKLADPVQSRLVAGPAPVAPVSLLADDDGPDPIEEQLHQLMDMTGHRRTFGCTLAWDSESGEVKCSLHDVAVGNVKP